MNSLSYGSGVSYTNFFKNYENKKLQLQLQWSLYTKNYPPRNILVLRKSAQPEGLTNHLWNQPENTVQLSLLLT
jgi:hypothetical protein